MRVKDVISKFKGATRAELEKAQASVKSGIVRESLNKLDDPNAHSRIRLLRYEKAVIAQALKMTTK